MSGATGMGSSPGFGWGGSPMGFSPYSQMGGGGGYFPYGAYSALGMFGR